MGRLTLILIRLALCVLAVSYAAALNAQTQPIVQTISSNGVTKLSGQEILLFEDASGSLSIEQVLARTSEFQTGKTEIPSYGVTNSAIWARLDLKSEEKSGSSFLEVAEPLLHNIELYGPILPGVPPQKKSAGRLLPFSEREIHHRKIIFPLNLKDTVETYYVRIRSADHVSVPLRVWPRREFFMAELTDQAWLGVFYGIIGALTLYNLFLFFSLRDRNYIYYVFYVLAFALLRMSVDGMIFQILPIESAWLNWRIPLFSGLICAMFVLLFSRNFLSLKNSPAPFRLPYYPLIGSMFVFMLLGLSDATMAFSSKYSNLIALLTLIYTVSCAVYRARTYKPARYFLFGWIVLLTGTFASSMVNLGFMPANSVTKNWMAIGFIAELLLFSFALGDRITLLRQEKEDADRKRLETQEKMASELEATVRDRTRELSLANATKDKFFSIIAHDLRGPVGSLSALFSEVIKDDGQLSPSLLGTIRKTASNTFHLLEDLLRWSESQRDAIEFRPEILELNRLIQETLQLIEGQAKNKGIGIQYVGDNSLSAFADAGMTSLIIRNFATNAIKFTHEGGNVSVDVKRIGDETEISVVDTGVGMTAEKANALFRIETKTVSNPGTNKESGSGLGLILCREFAEKNRGTVGVESSKGQGSRFWVRLPAAP